MFRGRRVDQILPADGGLLVSVRGEGLFLLRDGKADAVRARGVAVDGGEAAPRGRSGWPTAAGRWDRCSAASSCCARTARWTR